MKVVFKLLLFAQVAVTVFFFISSLPGRGRPETNYHPDLRGGGDWGFGGSDFYLCNSVIKGDS